MKDSTQSFISALKNPPRSKGEVPFYWWTGEKLDKKRLTHQLELLSQHGIAGVQVNYAHMNRGGENNEQYGSHGKTIPGDPLTFSDEWWEFFGYAAKECERLGMGIGVGDYTLAWIGNGYFTDIIAADEKMQATEISCEKVIIPSGYSPEEDVLAIIKYTDNGFSEPVIVYEKNKIPYCNTSGEECFVIKSKKIPLSINPMHPECGKMLTGLYFDEFERRLPDLKPGTLNYFFQDELSFGCNVKVIWGENLREGVLQKYGYDLLAFTPHLFFELGDITPKIRLNTADVKTTLMEEGYFRPVYNWHAERGLIYGCDQSGRGTIPTEFSDYFRTVRWFTAPGNDTPNASADLIKVKVNSSVAHLYKRPGTWLEGYHSSGWGTTLDAITAPTDDNFIFGATVLNLHGLYYTTNGGFFEWAPPDFHFRMPYWDDEKQWLDKYKRLSALLTAGSHLCDVALFYPTASCQVYSDDDISKTATFSAAKELFSHGIDFDFIDTQSLENASFSDGLIKAADEKYKVLIFAANRAVNYPVIEAIKKFIDNKGLVIFVGCEPSVSDRAGANDYLLAEDMKEILSSPGCHVVANNDAMLGVINRKITRLFTPDNSDDDMVYSLCRVCGDDRLFYVRYAKKDSVCRFSATGNAYLFNIENGKIFHLTGTLCIDGTTIVKIPDEVPDDLIILFSESEIETNGEISTSSFISKPNESVIELSDEWNFSVIPTLDNTYGDFYKPAGEMIGLQARFFDCAQVETEDETPKKYTYENLKYANTMGIRRIVAPEVSQELATALSRTENLNTGKIAFREKVYTVENLKIDDRYGHVSCTELTSLFEQGYHGLKGRVYDDNFFFEKDSVFIASVYVKEESRANIKISGQAPDVLYIGEKLISSFDEAVNLNAGENRIIAAYTVKDNCDIYRNRGPEKKAGILLAKCEEPTVQNTELAKCDFANDDYYHFGRGGLYVFSFNTAPGFNMMRCSCFGMVTAAFNDDTPMSVLPMEKGNFGANRFEIRTGNINKNISRVRLYIRTYGDLSYTGLIPEPIDLYCTEGVQKAVDLCETNSALCCFSGKMVYSNVFVYPRTDKKSKTYIEIEDAGCTVSLYLNDEKVAVMTGKPFRTEITDAIHEGENRIRIVVSNTLSNHYSTIPSRYANYPRDAKSGLIGSVKIITRQ